MKQKIIEILAYICYWTGIDSLFYFLNRKAKRIITFHNVIPSHLLPSGHSISYTDTEETFAMKIKEIKKHFCISTNILDSGTLTITFDDGYRNEYEITKNILGNDKGIIFVSGSLIDNNNPAEALVVDLLMLWTELVPNGKYHIDLPSIVETYIETSESNRQTIWQDIIWPSFVADVKTKGRNLLGALNKAYPIDNILRKCSPEYLRLRFTGFTTKEIENIRKDGWLVGWHTQEHFPLSSLPSEEKINEIAKTALLWMKDVAFSYPYGEMQSVDNECIQIVEDAGYPCAVSNLPHIDGSNTRLFMPRMTLADNKYILHFELSGAKHFIKYRKLLPQI